MLVLDGELNSGLEGNIHGVHSIGSHDDDAVEVFERPQESWPFLSNFHQRGL
jgi:hypothetical protein